MAEPFGPFATLEDAWRFIAWYDENNPNVTSWDAHRYTIANDLRQVEILQGRKVVIPTLERDTRYQEPA